MQAVTQQWAVSRYCGTGAGSHTTVGSKQVLRYMQAVTQQWAVAEHVGSHTTVGSKQVLRYMQAVTQQWAVSRYSDYSCYMLAVYNQY